MITLQVGEKISFVYNDKPRVGVVEKVKVEKNVATVLTTEGYRSFKIQQMQGLVRN